MKSDTPELNLLSAIYEESMKSPWARFNIIEWNDVIVRYNDEGFESSKALIKRADISAYRYEEAVNYNG